MKNIKINTNDKTNIMTIEIDLKKEFGKSASGKTIIVASTSGNQSVGEVVVGLNVYKYPEENKK